MPSSTSGCSALDGVFLSHLSRLSTFRCSSALTGVALFVAAAEFTGIKPIFYVKLGFVFLGLGTSVMIRRAVFGDQAALDRPIVLGTKILAVTSSIFWVAAITAGRYTAYIN